MRRLDPQENPGIYMAEAVGEWNFGEAKVLILCYQEKLLNAKLSDRTVNRHR